MGQKMRAAFFHDHRFGRDASGMYYSNGSLPYQAFLPYLRHFDTVAVVGRLQKADATTRTRASGAGLEMACLEMSTFARAGITGELKRHVRSVLSKVDRAIIRLPSLVGRIACREAFFAKKPFLVEVVGCAFDVLWRHGSLLGRLAALPAYLATRNCVQWAPFALYVTRNFLQRRYPCGGESVACPDVILAPSPPRLLAARLDRIRKLSSGLPLKLGLVGSLNVDYKGHDTAIRAAALLSDDRLPVQLRLLGGGNPARWRSRAANLRVEGCIEFCGTLPAGEPVLSWMDQLDVLLIPSLTEGMPRALLEAMSRALPAVGSRVGGIPELLDPEWTFAPGDASALADRVRRLLNDRGAMEAQAQRNWETAGQFSAIALDERRSAFLARFAASA
jgi:glycosyltransferase involved in cell wall biosynthesis